MMIVVSFLVAILNIFEIFLVIRCLMSWFPQVQASRIYDFIYTMTEPLLAPIRSFLMRFEFLRTMPIDFSVLVAFILLSIVQSMLYQF
ncbi:MAG: YggT family protein [Butyricicoccaceae bacterium]